MSSDRTFWPVALALVCWVFPVRAAELDLVLLADTDTTAPGASSDFTHFNAPALDGERVAFSGLASAPGIWLWDAGELEAVARSLDPLSGGTGSLRELGSPSLAGDTVALRVSGERTDLEAIYVARGGRFAPLVTVESGPEGGFRGFGELWFAEAGLAFTAVVSRPEPVQELWVIRDDEMARVAGESTEQPGADGHFHVFSDPCVDGDRVWFLGKGKETAGVYLASDGDVSAVATTRELMPGTRVHFERFHHLSGADGSVAFAARGDGHAGVYRSNGEASAVIADTRTPIPGRSTRFTGFAAVAADAKLVAFHGRGRGLHEGIYASRPGSPLVAVAQRGDSIDGRTITSVALHRQAVSNDRIALHLEFDDATQAIALASP